MPYRSNELDLLEAARMMMSIMVSLMTIRTADTWAAMQRNDEELVAL